MLLQWARLIDMRLEDAMFLEKESSLMDELVLIWLEFLDSVDVSDVSWMVYKSRPPAITAAAAPEKDVGGGGKE